LKARWQISPSATPVLKELNGDSVMLFRPTGFCGDGTYGAGTDGKTFYPNLSVLDSADRPSRMQIFTPSKPLGLDYEIHFISGDIRTLDHEAPDSSPSAREKGLKQALRNSPNGYQSVFARVSTENIWSRSNDLVQLFKNAKGVLIAPIVGANNFFPGTREAGMYAGDAERNTIPLRLSDETWRLLPNNDFKFAITYYAVPSADKEGHPYDIGKAPLAVVDYRGVQIRVASSQEIYDSESKLLIQFVNRFQPLPWIGRREE
jgi:hypothetical protein